MAKKEYIEREATLTLCQDFIDSYEDGSWRWVNAITDKDIMNIPAANVVEVVRCKDCKYLLKDLSEREAHLCMRNRFIRGRVNLDDFCGYGERKELDNGKT